jgi:hypothetical protein
VIVLTGEVDLENDGEPTTAAQGVLMHFPCGASDRKCGEQKAQFVLFFNRASRAVRFDEPLTPMNVLVLGE